MWRRLKRRQRSITGIVLKRRKIHEEVEGVGCMRRMAMMWLQHLCVMVLLMEPVLGIVAYSTYHRNDRDFPPITSSTNDHQLYVRIRDGEIYRRREPGAYSACFCDAEEFWWDDTDLKLICLFDLYWICACSELGAYLNHRFASVCVADGLQVAGR